jgi:Protein of unknown function (DUF1153)
MEVEDACELYTISVDEFLAWERDLDRYGLHGLRTTRYQITATPTTAPRPKAGNSHVRPAVFGPVMPGLFWNCRTEEAERWVVTVEDHVYGNIELAVLDAIDLANEARPTGSTAEVWHRSNPSRLY